MDPATYDAEPEALEVFYLTVPDKAAPRGQPIKGRVAWLWKLTPAAAQQFEDSLQRNDATLRTKFRFYRGQRELFPELADEDDPVSVVTPATAPSGAEPGPAHDARAHLAALQRSVELAQAQLQATLRDLEEARRRRDDEIQKHTELVGAVQEKTLTQLRTIRDFGIEQQGKAMEVDRQAQLQMSASWTQIGTTATTLATVRGVLNDSVLADRMEKYFGMAKDAVVGVSNSDIGRSINLWAATRIAELANKLLAQKGSEERVTADHVMLAAVLHASQFRERVVILSEYAAHARGEVANALHLGQKFLLGEATVEALQELVARSVQSVARMS